MHHQDGARDSREETVHAVGHVQMQKMLQHTFAVAVLRQAPLAAIMGFGAVAVIGHASIPL